MVKRWTADQEVPGSSPTGNREFFFSSGYTQPWPRNWGEGVITFSRLERTFSRWSQRTWALAFSRHIQICVHVHETRWLAHSVRNTEEGNLSATIVDGKPLRGNRNKTKHLEYKTAVVLSRSCCRRSAILENKCYFLWYDVIIIVGHKINTNVVLTELDYFSCSCRRHAFRNAIAMQFNHCWFMSKISRFCWK